MGYSVPPPYSSQPNPPQPSGMPTGAKIGLGVGGGCCGLIVFGFVGLLMLGAIGSSMEGNGGTEQADAQNDNDDNTDDDEDEDNGEDDSDEEATYEVGDEIEHGDFVITVESVEGGVEQVAAEFGSDYTPTDTYVVVELTAENISSSSQYLSGSDQVLMDDAGSMYERDSSASSGASFMDDINPGQAVDAELVYDVPEDVDITHMMVNGDSMFADGERVDLDL